jgi:hypothetical protein
MLDECHPGLRPAFACSRKGCVRTRATARQRDIGMQLGEIASANPRWRSAAIRSSIRRAGPTRMWCCVPVMCRRSRRAKSAVEDMLERVRGAIERRLTDSEHRCRHRPSRAFITRRPPPLHDRARRLPAAAPCARLTAAARQSVDRERRRCRQDRRSPACCARAAAARCSA